MQNTGLPIALRWLFFVLGIGAMISAGIYLKAYIDGGTVLGEGLRALMFFLLGTFFMLMYGENKCYPKEKPHQRTSSRKSP